MKTNQFHNATLNTHGVDITTDKGERFGIACPDEPTARTIAAGGEAIELLRTVTQYEHDPKIGAMIDQFLNNLIAVSQLAELHHGNAYQQPCKPISAMLTTDQRNEMRRCIVGPCTEQEKQEIREGLERIGEKVESESSWNLFDDMDNITIDGFNEWSCRSDLYTPTITAADFIKTYLKP